MKLITYQFSDRDFDSLDYENLEYDHMFIQRCPRGLVDKIPYKTEWIQNYADPIHSEWSRGLCIIHKKEEGYTETHQFVDVNWNTNTMQGKHYQIFHLNNLKIINAGISYPDKDMPEEMYINQAIEVMNLVDDKTILVGDFHAEDHELPYDLKLDKRSLWNHVHCKSFLKNNGAWLSLQKIITTPTNHRISNVDCFNTDRQGHHPIHFEIYD